MMPRLVTKTISSRHASMLALTGGERNGGRAEGGRDVQTG